jgi:hypothetical protein
MTDPLERATSRPPPTLGEGCVRRYDPEAMDDSVGSDFPGAAELWQQLQSEQAQAKEVKPPRK